MKIDDYTILKNEKLAEDVYKMTFSGKFDQISAPGQFVNIKIDGFYLRRPISIAYWDEHSMTIIYKIVGKGIRQMSSLIPGDQLNILLPLGNGYDISKIGNHPLLIGGGAGVPPMIGLAKALISIGKTPQVILGFAGKPHIFAIDDFSSLGIFPLIATEDGTAGTKGMVTDVMKQVKYDYVCACGPEPMLHAVDALSPDGQFSFEARMGCGFGSCMGCSCHTKYGDKRICKDGPVLFKEEIIW